MFQNSYHIKLISNMINYYSEDFPVYSDYALSIIIYKIENEFLTSTVFNKYSYQSLYIKDNLYKCIINIYWATALYMHLTNSDVYIFQKFLSLSLNKFTYMNYWFGYTLLHLRTCNYSISHLIKWKFILTVNCILNLFANWNKSSFFISDCSGSINDQSNSKTIIKTFWQILAINHKVSQSYGKFLELACIFLLITHFQNKCIFEHIESKELSKNLCFWKEKVWKILTG